MAKTLFLVDGSAIAYRSYFAFINNPLINSKGQNTSAVFGFLRFLFMIYDNEHPDHLAVVFDPKGPTFRHQQYSAYKATRQKMPDDMRDQVPLIHSALKALNIPVVEKPGFEADDVIGTLAKRAQNQGFESYLVSGDKDFMQLVDKHIRLYNPKRAGEAVEILDEAGVLEKVGLPPSKIIDYLGLMGDTSDNVPGVKGVGQKTAVKLLNEFGSLEEVLQNADKVSRANVRENLQTYRDDALLSKQLVTIDLEVELDIDLESFRCVDVNRDELIPLLQEFEFHTLVDRFRAEPTSPSANYQIADSAEKLEAMVRDLRKAGRFALSVETTDPQPMRAEIIGLAFAIRPGEAFYVPVKVERRAGGDGITAVVREMFLPSAGDLFGTVSLNQFLKPLFEDGGILKSGHNLKSDMIVLARHGIGLQGLDFDTMVASYLINPAQRAQTLEALALEHLNIVKMKPTDLLGKGRKQLTFAELAIDKAAQYCCENVDVVRKLMDVFEPQLRNGNLMDLYRDVERPLVEVLRDVERDGVSLDLEFLANMSKEMAGKLEGLVAQIYELAGEEFNINSTQQLGQILFEKLKLPKKKRTKTGYSTDAKVLEALAEVHEMPKTLLEYRELTKLKSTYVDALPSLVNPETGRLHTSYNQTVAATGRLSSSDPNLQNIPIRTVLGREIRRAFVPRAADHVILDADYSQIELRVMAHLSKDPTLLEAFRNEEDIHTKTASLVFAVEPQDLTAEHRRRAKEINFGIMYGMGVYGLASRLNISNDEARDFIFNYFAQYGQVQEFILRMHRQVEQHGYVTTLLNRRRYLPEINSKNRNIHEFAKRTAVNTPIQGTAAELLKVAMINIWRKLSEGGFGARMIMQVHDELVFEVPRSEISEVRALVKVEMENAMPLDVPIRAEIGVADNWLEAH